MANLGKRRALFLGTAVDDQDGTTVDHDEKRRPASSAEGETKVRGVKKLERVDGARAA